MIFPSCVRTLVGGSQAPVRGWGACTAVSCDSCINNCNYLMHLGTLTDYGIGSKREDGDVGCDDDGRSPVMLLSHRAPLYAAIARERHLRCSRGDGPKNKRVRAAPVAPLVPTLQQEDAVLDLSSLARPRKNPGHDIPLSSEEFPRLDSEELQRVFLLPLFQATTGASATTITPVIQRPAESQGNAWTALFQRCTSAIQADDP